MIHEVDEALRTLIRRDALNGTGVEVLLDAPTKDWSARRTTPTLDLYLYDIREDLQWRSYGSVDVRDQNGLISARGVPPRYYKLSYLVTAWTQRPEDEHRLLSAVLHCFLRFESLPKDVLPESLSRSGLPLRTTVALPPPQDRALSDVWSALGGELKPSLDLVVAAPIDARGLADVAPLVLEEPRLSFESSDRAVHDERAGRPGRTRPRPPVPEESVEAGQPRRKGRVVRVRGSAER